VFNVVVNARLVVAMGFLGKLLGSVTLKTMKFAELAGAMVSETLNTSAKPTVANPSIMTKVTAKIFFMLPLLVLG